MKGHSFEIWITLENECPDLEDIAKAQIDLENLGIGFNKKVGIGFTPSQWAKFLLNLSRFESRFVRGIPAVVCGLPVRLIEERNN